MAPPFAAIPDLLYASDVSLDVKQLEAVNVGARYSPPGQRVLTRNMGDVYQSLEQFRIELDRAAGVQHMQGQGSDLLGNSVRVVRWVTDQLICKAGNG